MLRSLHIENVAVIRRADLEFDRGFSVLTGETGAGKSMIIDSINLLLGNRVSKEIIRSGEEQAQVGAVFEELSDGVCAFLEEMGFPSVERTLMLRRTLSTDGRSRAYLNGQMVTQAILKEIAGRLISIHGQSDSQRLLQKKSHIELLDAFAKPIEQKGAYAQVYAELQASMKKLKSISQDESERMRLAEMLKYQIEDIDSVKPKAGEEERLIKERDLLLGAEQINKQISLAYRALCGGEKTNARDLVKRAEQAVRSLNGLIDGAEAHCERLLAAASELEDVGELLLSYSVDDADDPTARIDRIEARLEKISKLKKKYGSSVEEILAFRNTAARRLEELECSDEMRLSLEKECARLRGSAQDAARALSEKRAVAAREITRQVTEALAFLDMPRVRFEVAVMPTELSPLGADDVEFLIAANPGEPLLPMIKIASGGELSRIMLSLRSVLNDRDGAETVIFDEIDTGVSGKTSRKIGIKLKESAQNAQVLCVTHSAQIASLADTHFRIVKEEREGRAETDVFCLDDDARIEEIARILGGIEVTAAQRNAAMDMINEYR